LKTIKLVARCDAISGLQEKHCDTCHEDGIALMATTTQPGMRRKKAKSPPGGQGT
jgi:hypothetical protein